MQQQNDKQDTKPGLSWTMPSSTKALPAAAEGSRAGRYTGMFALGVVVGVLVMWGITAATKPGQVSTTAKPSTANSATQNGSNNAASGVAVTSTGAVASGAALQVPSPQKAGLSVSIAKAGVAKPTWVVVYESRDGAPGNVLGAHLFDQTGAGTVTLLRATVAGQEYFAGMSPDNGDRKYSKALDKAEAASDGSLIVVRFTAQ